MDRRTVLVVLLVVAGGLGTWLAWPVAEESGLDPGVASGAVDAPPQLAGREAPPMETGDALLTGYVWRGGARVDAQVELAWVEAADDRPLWHRAGEAERGVMTWAAALRTRARSTQATADAGFSISLASGARYALRARQDDGGGAVTLSFLLPAGAAEKRVHVQLPAGDHALTVQVRDTLGAPVHASVFLRGDVLPGKQGELTGPRRTDDAGRVVFAGLDGGAARAFARIGDLEIASPYVAVPREEPLLLTVPRLDAPLTIRVRDGDTDAPIGAGDVRVDGQMRDGTYWSQDARIEAGVAAVAGAPVPVMVTVEAPGYATTAINAAADERELSVRLFETPRVSGTVVHADSGAPVPHVRVSFIDLWRGEIGRFDEPRHVVTDARGAFTIRPGRWGRSMVWVFDQGLVSEGLAAVSKTVNPCVIDVSVQVVEGVTLMVEPAARVEGTIHTVDGKPVSGAVLHLDQERIKEERIGNPFDFDDLFRRTAFVVKAKSNAKGGFTFSTLIPGWAWSGWANKAGYEISPQLVLVPQVGSTTSFTLLAKPVEEAPPASDPDDGLRPGIFLVRVTGDAGKPIPGATVMVWARETIGNHMPDALRTGPEGLLALDRLPRERLMFRASAPGHATLNAHARPEDDAITLKLTPGLFVSGTVVLPDGTPAIGASMTVVTNKPPEAGDAIGWRRPSRTSLRATWDADGAFRVAPVASGQHTLEVTLVRGGQRYFASHPITAGSSTRITLAEAELREPRFGRPGMLVVRGPGGETLGRATLHDYSLAGGTNGWPTMWGMSGGVHEMPDDDYPLWIDVVRPVLANGRYAPYGEIRLGPYRAGGGPDSLEVELPPEKTIAGRVLLPGGEPAQGYLVEAFTAPPEGYTSDQTWISSNAFTDMEGRFLLRQLGNLAYDIKVKPQAGTTAAQVRVAAGAKGVTVRLAATLAATVTVLDAAGRPLDGVKVALRDPDGPRFMPGPPQVEAETDGEGRALLSGLDAKRVYRLSCKVPADRGDLHPHTQGRWAPQDTTVRLVGAHALAGRVARPEGAPLEGVTIAFRPKGQDDAGSFTQKTGADGTFLLPRVPTGSGILTLWQPGMREGSWTREIRVPSGAPLDLVLDPGRTLRVEVGTPSPKVRRVLLRLLAVDTAGKRLGSIWSAAPGVGAAVPFYGLQPKQRHALFALVHDGDEHLAAWVPGIATDVTELRVPWRPALATELVIEGGASSQKGYKRVQIIQPWVEYQRLFEGERTTLHLPAGTWRLHVRARSGGDTYSTEVDVEAGGTYRLTLDREGG